MWLELIQLAVLACLCVLIWYAGEALPVLKRIDISFDRLRAFLDAQDINRRKDETEEIAEVTIDRALVRAWLPGTQILLGKLLASTERIGRVGEELIAPGRVPVAMSPPLPVTGAPPLDDVAPLAALPSAPAQIAAGIGPRPSSSIVPAKGPGSRERHAPPVRLTDSTRAGLGCPGAEGRGSFGPFRSTER
jgi:hypothetical protein